MRKGTLTRIKTRRGKNKDDAKEMTVRQPITTGTIRIR